ncbi:MAG: GTP cyclohydrolase FolE2 [Burkholderiales bacterium]|jgi:GTP cyclohydrolase I|nr:GTP cyclohydrolase FolE2 [Burkholderiales bacterium]
MNVRDTVFLPDVQGAADARNVAIARVGVRSMRWPLTVATAQGTPQPTVAEADMYVALPATQKGTHMSRFIEVLQRQAEPLGAGALPGLLSAMLARLDAERGEIALRFPFFVTKRAPVSGVESLLDYQVQWRVAGPAQAASVTQTVVVPVTSLCPCSKKVADYGAHNQRSHITIAAELAGELSLERQIRIAEEAASSEMWALLKRPDEKYVTERAYDNPKFVEDMVRDVALALDREPAVAAYRVEVENFESIHNHSAYAQVERDKRAR